VLSEAKAAKLREIVKRSAAFLVGNDEWPYGDSHVLLLIGDKGADPAAIAGSLARWGIDAQPLPQSDGRIYPFLATAIEPSPEQRDDNTLYPMQIKHVEAMVRAHGIAVAAVSHAAVETSDQLKEQIASRAEDWLNPPRGHQDPYPISSSQAITGWVWMRVRAKQGTPPLSTRAVKQRVEAHDYKVIAPDIGITGFFESIFSDYVIGQDTWTLINPNRQLGTTSSKVQDVAFPHGTTWPPDYTVSFHMTDEIKGDSQDTLDWVYRMQGVEGAAGDAGAAGRRHPAQRC